jgi:vacuolar-type H+-ATPase subunit D/Vma8
MKLKYIFCICAVLLLIMACAKPPEAEMQSAREAVYRAENDPDAVQYGYSSLARARSALSSMQAEADSKRYDAAKTHAAEAIAAAEKAIADGKSGAANVKNEAASVIAGLKGEIEETSRNVNGARYSLLDLDYDALDRSIVNAYNTSDQAEVDYASSRYQDAINKAMDVRSNLSNINNMVANAVVRKKG